MHLRIDDAEHQLQVRSEEHTSELQSQSNLVCRLLLEKKKIINRLRLMNFIVFPSAVSRRVVVVKLFAVFFVSFSEPICITLMSYYDHPPCCLRSHHL